MSDNKAKNVADKSDDNKWRRSVSFNKTKPIDAKLLKHIGRRNFSGYVKKLIVADMIAKEKDKEISQPTLNTQYEGNKPLASSIQLEEAPLTTAEKLEQMKRQSKKTGNGASQPKSFINHQ